MECAGGGRARLAPRPVSARGTTRRSAAPSGPERRCGRPRGRRAAGRRWSSLHRLTTEASTRASSRPTSAACTVEEAMRDVLLAYAMNGSRCRPRTASRCASSCPMVRDGSVKWLRSITAIASPSRVSSRPCCTATGAQDEPGTPVTRKQPRALMAPPGIPEFFSRIRHLPVGRTRIEGRAWSGAPRRARGVQRRRRATWEDARLGAPTAGTAGERGRTSGSPPAPATTSCASARPTPPATRSPSTAPRLESRRVRRQRGPARGRACRVGTRRGHRPARRAR